MGKAIKCKLIFHGACREIPMGEFPSVAAAKKYVSECWNRPYTIIKLKPKKVQNFV